MLWMSSGSWIVFISFFDLWYTSFLHRPLVWCLRTSMYRHEPQGLIWFFLCFFSQSCGAHWLLLYDWQTATVWVKHLCVQLKKVASWMPCRGGADKQLRNSFAKRVIIGRVSDLTVLIGVNELALLCWSIVRVTPSRSSPAHFNGCDFLLTAVDRGGRGGYGGDRGGFRGGRGGGGFRGGDRGGYKMGGR